MFRHPFFLGCCLVLAIFLCFSGCSGRNPAPAFPGWNLTVAGDEVRVFTLEEIMQMPSVSGHGYAVSTVGIRYGPFTCRGVALRDLVSTVGELGPKDQIWISAPDGYLWVFDHDQLDGKGFVTFNESLKEIPSPALTILLMFEENGRPLTYDEGGPLRVAIISEEPGVITEGSAWVKWVNRIEIHRK
jgi:DMSO/TMAO reductase YedYZ molybdopterin-dependent catalytic subunit